MKKEDEIKETRPVATMKADDEAAGRREEALNADVSKEERELLEKSETSTGSPDDELLQQAALDSTDEDGTPLNERTDQSGSELDVPGSEEDDSDEEDEENNPYSLNDDKEDEINTRQ